MMKFIFNLFILGIIYTLSASETTNCIQKSSPPVINITHEEPFFEKFDDKIIVNHYKLSVLNPNNQAFSYKFQLNNKKFSHSIKKDISLASDETKTIFFEIYIYSEDTTDLKNTEKLKVIVFSKENSALSTIEQIEFQVRNKEVLGHD